jgi:hypothetical protein
MRVKLVCVVALVVGVLLVLDIDLIPNQPNEPLVRPTITGMPAELFVKRSGQTLKKPL